MRLPGACCAIAIFTASCLCGCAGSAPRADSFPPFYVGWNSVPPELAQEAEVARLRLDDGSEDRQDLKDFAHAIARLARWQAAQWLELAAAEPEPGRMTNERERGARRRTLEGARQALSIYREIQIVGTPLAWQARVEMAWLLLLSGADVEGQEMLAAVLADPLLDDAGRVAVAALADAASALPPEKPVQPELQK